jgi:hypothetical protein
MPVQNLRGSLSPPNRSGNHVSSPRARHTHGAYNALMPQFSESEQSWNDRARTFNYRCRGCRECIAFADQELYFRQGLCTPCFDVIAAEARDVPDSRMEEIRRRGGYGE